VSEFRGGAGELFRAGSPALTAPEVLLSGPAGTGKSLACLTYLHQQMANHDGARGVIVRKSLTRLKASAVATFEQHVIAGARRRRDVGALSGFTKDKPPHWRYRNGSEVWLIGMDDSERIKSAEFDVVYCQEATELSETDWELITSRLRHGVTPVQQVVADCNPDVPTHWLLRRCQRGHTLMIESRHGDNPAYVNEDGSLTPAGNAYLLVLHRLTGVRRERLLDGRWCAAEGVIYPEFDPAVHVIDAMPEGWQHWPRYWSIDFGTTSPSSLQCWARNPTTDQLIMYREVYGPNLPGAELARSIMAIVAPGGTWVEPRPHAIVCDTDGQGIASFRSASGLRVVKTKKGVDTATGQGSILAGIEETQRRLKPGPFGEPGMLFLRDALVARDPELDAASLPCGVVEELPGYCWDRDDAGVLRRERPADRQADHGCDAMRYVAWLLRSRPAATLTWL